ncbi:hypothetical protein SAMN05216223_12919 [Actinacidiphila yanglinensis]|uniref:Uncharacterized protein n=1 Tax=Actinacidiphila yanglinensis TaxID=310779 RepID=A0A1H6E8M3_9ACTN|nr:hypothetical protein [Actinacidiphila yanglinensis]SEG94037.1 hypothetical protein SAMN05216223_12919 [Actinacidiphila yanglinensis]
MALALLTTAMVVAGLHFATVKPTYSSVKCGDKVMQAGDKCGTYDSYTGISVATPETSRQVAENDAAGERPVGWIMVGLAAIPFGFTVKYLVLAGEPGRERKRRAPREAEVRHRNAPDEAALNAMLREHFDTRQREQDALAGEGEDLPRYVEDILQRRKPPPPAH